MNRARCGVRPLLYLMTCLLGFAPPAAAQFGVGSIGGTATDGSGGVLPGVTVTLSNPGVIGGDQTAVTDADGSYQFARLVPGTYTIKGELQGFRSFVQERIGVNADRNSRVDLKLDVGNVAETVTVSGQAPLLDTTSALNQTVLPRETIDALPTGYDTWSIARLAPAVHLDKYDVGGREMFGQSNASAHGSTEREYFIDGMDLNQYGGTFYIDSFAFQEVNIQTANMTAERSTGGVVWNFVTKTGSNKFSGTGAFLGMTHGCCEADNISDETEKVLLAAVPPYALAADPTPSLGNSVEHMYDLSVPSAVQSSRTDFGSPSPASWVRLPAARRQLQRRWHAVAERQPASPDDGEGVVRDESESTVALRAVLGAQGSLPRRWRAECHRVLL